MRFVTLAITAAVLATHFALTRDHPSADSAAPFHAEVLQRVGETPEQVGEWVIVADQEAPPAAVQLLRLNAMLARVYRNGRTGEQATLLIVQTADVRDMAGHYPPNCYPAHGWSMQRPLGAPRTLELRPASILSGSLDAAPAQTLTIPVQGYDFRQKTFSRERHLRIWCFFAVPGRGFVSDIEAVRDAAEDYRVRPFGAAQIQVILSGDTTDERADEVTRELAEGIAPLLTLLSESRTQGAERPSEPHDVPRKGDA